MKIVANTVYYHGVRVGDIADTVAGAEFKGYLDTLNETNVELASALKQEEERYVALEDYNQDTRLDNEAISFTLTEALDTVIHNYNENPDGLTKSQLLQLSQNTKKTALEELTQCL